MSKWKGEKKTKAKKIVTGVLLIYLGLLLVAYIAGTVYYSKHFFSGSRINGLDCSGKTVEEVEDAISQGIDEYTLTLKERNGQYETIDAAQIALTYVSDGKIQKLKKQQNPFTWFLSFTGKNSFEMSATTTHDDNLLGQVTDSLGCFQEENVTKPADAYVGETDTGFVVMPEEMGNELDKEKALSLITAAIEGGKAELDFDQEDCYLKPAVYSTDEKLLKQAEQSNELVKAVITISFGDRQEIVNKDVIKGFFTTDVEGNVSLDEAKVKEYVVSLAKKYDTFGYPRQFVTSNGNTITTSGGDYGWLMARNDTTAKLLEALKSGQSQTIEPDYTFRGYIRNADDIGNTYVEISLEQQHMWFYKDGQLLVSTDIVTGNHNTGMDTKTGVYGIMYKERNATLVGENYSSPVSYWMPFYPNVGIHDASWKTVFGGSEYINNGSHGCVNTPLENAEKIYNNIEKGVPVVVY